MLRLFWHRIVLLKPALVMGLAALFLFFGLSAATAEERPKPPVPPDPIQADLEGMKSRLQAYEAEHGAPPPDLAVLFDGHQPVDPWGSDWVLEAFTEMDAGMTGLDYQVRSPGPDLETGTDDDLAWPLPDPDFEPSPIMQQILGPEEEVEE